MRASIRWKHLRLRSKVNVDICGVIRVFMQELIHFPVIVSKLYSTVHISMPNTSLLTSFFHRLSQFASLSRISGCNSTYINYAYLGELLKTTRDNSFLIHSLFVGGCLITTSFNRYLNSSTYPFINLESS